MDQALSSDQVRELCMSVENVDPFSPNETEEKEREIIRSHRVKLTEYIHDITALFPFMKEKGVYSIDDCDVIRAEQTGRLKVDKFIDILFTKGPRAVGTFHEALATNYPGLFDYLTRLFTKAGIDLPESRKMRPAEHQDEDTLSLLDNEGSVVSGFRENDQWQRISRRSRTVKRSLELLSRQMEYIQKERDELKNSLSQREKHITELLKSKNESHKDLMSITQSYHDLYSQLVQWKESLSLHSEGSSKRLQELVSEKESIQLEYEALENDYMLVQSEVRAARDRISRLMAHLERSEQLVALTQDERDKLQTRVDVLEGEVQRHHRLLKRIQREPPTGSLPRPPKSNMELEDQIRNSGQLAQMDFIRQDLGDLTERLRVARHERTQALEEKEKLLQDWHLEKENRKKVEKELKQARQKIQRLTSTPNDPSDLISIHSKMSNDEPTYHVKMEDFTTIVQTAEDMGMELGLAVMVTSIRGGSLVTKSGIQQGDQICQVNHINVNCDRDPLDLCMRLLRSASSLVTLLIRRPIVAQEKISIPQAAPSDNLRPATLPRFSLPVCSGPVGGWHDSQSSTLPARDFHHNGNATTPTSLKDTAIRPYHISASSSNSSKSDGERERFADTSDRPTLQRSSHGMDVSFDDNNSTHGYSSDLSNEESGHTRYSTSSNALLLQSPTTKRQFTIDSDIIPKSVTRPPTLREGALFGEDYYHSGLGGKRDISPEEFGKHLQYKLKSLTANAQMHDNQLASDGELDSPYFDEPPLFKQPSSPNDTESDNSLPTTPTRQRRLYRNRPCHIRSQVNGRVSMSLDDMSHLLDRSRRSSTFPKPDIELIRSQRRVILQRGFFGTGVKLVGGRGRGLFISSSRSDSRGLQSGDEVIKIGNQSTEKMTYAEAMAAIDAFGMKGEECIITVTSNEEGYEKLPPGARDNFYVKALFTHKHSRSNNELQFLRGDVFRVCDTLPQGMKNYWKVLRIDYFGSEINSGYIPIEQSPMDLADNSYSIAASLPRLFGALPLVHRMSSQQTTAVTPGASISPDLWSEDMHRNVYDMYQPVERVKVDRPRPIIILGIQESQVVEILLDDPMFEKCPVESTNSLASLEDQLNIKYILTSRNRSTVNYCNLSKVEAIMDKEAHCILTVHPAMLKRNSTLDSLHPIILFLHTTKGATMLRLQLKIPSEGIATQIVHMKNLEEKLSGCFTGVVDVSGNIENIVKQVKAEIQRQQQMAIWENEQP